jgi:Mg/Co/Ni transporter MgtE
MNQNTPPPPALSDLPVAAAPSRLGSLAAELVALAPDQAAELLDPLPDAEVATVLSILSPAVAEDIMLAMGEERRKTIIAAAPLADANQWTANFTYPDGSVGRLMEPPRAVFRPELNVDQTTERLRHLRFRGGRGGSPSRRGRHARPPPGRQEREP